MIPFGGDYTSFGGMLPLGRPAVGSPYTPIQSTTQPSNPVLGGMAQSPFQDFLGMLTKRINIPTGRTTKELQGIYNLGRTQIQGATQAGLGMARGFMGGRGFRGGESGLADTAMGQIIRGGQQNLAGLSAQTSIDEANRRFSEQSTLAQLNLSRLLGGGQMALGGEQSAMDALLGLYGAQTGAQLSRWQPYWAGVTSASSQGF